MAKQISQETFDGVVQENIQDFEMSPEEAIADAVTQFESQGVNLANIVKDLALRQGDSASKHPAIEAVENLQAALALDPVNENAIKSNLEKLKSECDIDLAHRCLAGKNNAYEVLFKLLEKFQSSPEMVGSILSAWIALFNGQPDLLDAAGRALLLKVLQEQSNNVPNATATIKVIRLSCVMHESNRQAFVEEKLIPALMSALEEHKDSAEVVRETCHALRTLTFDDDPRVPFGKAHEHAKMIVQEADALRKILAVSKDYIDNTAVLGELFLTLSKLAVRNEFCQEIMDLGGLGLMLGALEKNMDHQGIVSQALIVLKAIAGNDEVKVAVVKSNGVELILSCMEKHIRQSGVCETGCAALTTLSLRNPDHCDCIIRNNGPEIILKAMQIHANKPSVQKQACMLIRNCVARTRQYCEEFLKLGAESLIHDAMTRHADICKDEAKGALRDLDCKVELQTPWMNQGQGIKQ